MREKRAFAERTRVFLSDKTLRKYFLVYEGSVTEAIYFEAVDSMRDIIGISPLIKLIPVIRSYSEDGGSDGPRFRLCHPHEARKQMRVGESER